MEWELRMLDALQSIRTPLGDMIMSQITALGNGGILWIILACVLLAFPKTRNIGFVVAVALCWDLVLCNGILKNLFARIRPFDVNTSIELLISKPKDYSFPSGHTAASFAAVAGLYFSGGRKLWKIALPIALAIAFSRLYLYVHYPTDILGGALVGILSGYAGYQTVKMLRQKFFADKNDKL